MSGERTHRRGEAPAAPGAALQLARSVRAETARLVRWPAVWITLIAWFLLNAAFGYVFPYLSYRSDGGGFGPVEQARATLLAGVLPAGVPDTLVQGMPMFGGALALVLGALVAASGYSWGSQKTVFTLGPTRLASTGGAMLALGVVVVVMVVLTVVLDLVIALVIAGIEGASAAPPGPGDLASSTGTGLLILVMWAAAGFALGSLTRGTGLSVGLGLVWALVVENLLRGVGTLLDWVQWLTELLPGTNAGSLVGAVTGNLGAPGVIDAVGGTRALITVVVWLVASVAAALLTATRRDLSG